MINKHESDLSAGEKIVIDDFLFVMRMPNLPIAARQVESSARRQGSETSEEGTPAVEQSEGQVLLPGPVDRNGLSMIRRIFKGLQWVAGYVPVDIPAEFLTGPLKNCVMGRARQYVEVVV